MRTNWKKYVGILLPLAAVVAAPMVMRNTGTEAAREADRRLEIITPHNETIRREFGEGFAAYWEKKTGQSVYVNWRTPGGTSEIKRVLDSAYEAAAEGGREGIGIDLFYGGGEYDFSKQASLGRFEKLRIFETQKELFEKEVIPARLSGEKYFDPDHTWIGAVLSSFGICYNVDLVKARGLAAPTSWDDLGDPGYARGIAMADTTKSSSVTKAFEMLVQQKIQQEMARAAPDEPREQVVALGWEKSMQLIQRIGANSRYFTDSSAKIPRDVAQGNAVAGMAIDFYGRTISESVKRSDGSSRMQFLTPPGGSSISVDPIAVLKGAPHEDLAQAFVEYVLSKEGQMIWAAAPGHVPGPKYRALRRLPIRRDLYEGKWLEAMVDKGAMPYVQAEKFTYDPELTGHLFTPLRTIFRAMCIDPHPEMREAWQALIDTGFQPESTARFHDVSAISYEKAGGEIRSRLKAGKVESVRLMNELSSFFRANYAEAKRLAREGR